MNVRGCAYKGCENFYVNGSANGNFTLFQFPKDVERRKIWLKNAQIPAKSILQPLYMCSDHFDPKYMSVNNRRTALVNVAVPYVYQGNPMLDIKNEQEDEDRLELEIEALESDYEVDPIQLYDDKVEYEEDYQVESTNNEYEDGNESKEDGDISFDLNEKIETDNKGEIIFKIASNSIQINRKRTFTESATVHQNNSKIFRQEVPQQKPKAFPERKNIKAIPTVRILNTPNRVDSSNTPSTPEELPNSNEVILTESDLIDSQFVTKFIYKKVEYVQMTKSSYLQEKLTLLKKIKEYENILKFIKTNVDKIEV